MDGINHRPNITGIFIPSIASFTETSKLGLLVKSPLNIYPLQALRLQW